MTNYRVFISYSHDNKELAEKIVEILEENGLKPMWDKDFKFSHRFTDQIKNFIAHAHVFVPIITEESSNRGWVHQEIGYAMALNIPLLPICRGKLPGEMIREYQAVMLEDVSQERVNELTEADKEMLNNCLRDISQMIELTEKSTSVLYECGQYHDDRTKMMVDYSDHVLGLGESGIVRQKGALSSFSIPNMPIFDEVWKQRYGSCERGERHCELLRRERKSLETHAHQKGVRLIIDPFLTYSKYGDEARIVRLNTLLKYLEHIRDDGKVEIAINKDMSVEHSLTIVGDWFAAESVSAALGKGYRQTIFTRHAPSVIEVIKQFDDEFNSLLSKQPKEISSREYAIQEIGQIIAVI